MPRLYLRQAGPLVIKISDDGRELCLSCGFDDDGVLVERAGCCDTCGREIAANC